MRTQSAALVPAVPRQVKKDDECVVLGDSAESALGTLYLPHRDEIPPRSPTQDLTPDLK